MYVLKNIIFKIYYFCQMEVDNFASKLKEKHNVQAIIFLTN